MHVCVSRPQLDYKRLEMISSVPLHSSQKAFTVLAAHRTLRKGAHQGCLLNQGCKKDDRASTVLSPKDSAAPAADTPERDGWRLEV